MVQSEGCEAVAASGGAEALNLFAREKFDAVFTDVGMPGMSGWELSRLIRERDSHLPLAVITGWGDVVGTGEQEAARIDWVVTKPFSMNRIAEIMRDILQRKSESRRSELAPVAA